jgi:hypothetical protein
MQSDLKTQSDNDSCLGLVNVDAKSVELEISHGERYVKRLTRSIFKHKERIMLIENYIVSFINIFNTNCNTVKGLLIK